MPDEPVPGADDDTGAASARATGAILRLMERRGISRSELARRLGASPAHVTQILRGGTNFTLASLEKLAAALGAELEVRFGLVGEAAEPVGRARERAAPAPAAEAAEGARERRSRPRPRRREPPRPARPAPTTEPDASWRVW